MALWGKGRFTGRIDPLMHEFNQSFSYDKAMYKADITGSIAYAGALRGAGILTAEQCQTVQDGLRAVLAEWEQGKFVSNPETDEDIHSANERRLSELIGKDLGGRLHTGRSRNDQVATDMRLWLLEHTARLRTALTDLISVLARRAEVEIEEIMPGYTHLQRAQPVRWAHFLMCHAVSLLSDLSRLDSSVPRLSVLPLGSGPLAGNPFAISREDIRQELGFESLSLNSMQAVADRDFVAEFMFWASMTMVHISRIAEDLIIYASAEFGFVTLSDAYSTGSSIMPQKKNADSLELLRGKSGRVLGNMTGFLTTMKGQPLCYNKDTQEDKEPLFDTALTVERCIRILEGVMSTLTIHPTRMRQALTDDLLATDLAEYLVRKGMPFRDTHHIAGAAVRLAEETGGSLSTLTLEQLRGLSSQFEPDVRHVFDFTASVERRDVPGGTSKRAVLATVATVKQAVGA